MKPMLISLAAALVNLAVAGPIHDFGPNDLTTPLSPGSSNITSNLVPRKTIVSMWGTCVRDDKEHTNACKVNLKSYPCLNSNCAGRLGEKCKVAHGMQYYEAKCPNNELSFEWEWPWKAPK